MTRFSVDLDKAKMYHAMADALAEKSYEVTLVLTVTAKDQGQAIRKSIDDFHESRTKVSVKDVREV